MWWYGWSWIFPIVGVIMMSLCFFVMLGGIISGRGRGFGCFGPWRRYPGVDRWPSDDEADSEVTRLRDEIDDLRAELDTLRKEGKRA